MRAIWSRYKRPVLCLLLLLLPFLFFYSNAKKKGKINFFDKIIIQISAPIQNLFNASFKFFDGLWKDYIYLQDMKAENERLKKELKLLKEKQNFLASAASQNQRLNRLLGLKTSRPKLRLIPAQVVARSASPYFRVLRIRIKYHKGEQIKRGMPVINAEGVVGRINRTVGNYADVRLLADAASSIYILVQGSRATGFLQGRGEPNTYRCRIEYLSRKDRVNIGDKVVTSGLGKEYPFPKGLAAGKISHVIRSQYGIHQEVVVTPSVDFSKIEELFIVTGSENSSLPPLTGTTGKKAK